MKNSKSSKFIQKEKDSLHQPNNAKSKQLSKQIESKFESTMEVINSKRDSYSTSLDNIDLSQSNRQNLSLTHSNPESNKNKSKSIPSNNTQLTQIQEQYKSINSHTVHNVESSRLLDYSGTESFIDDVKLNSP